MIAGVTEFLSADTRRPLTDRVVVGAPEQVSYDIDLTYYIRQSESKFAIDIQNAVNQAVNDYIIWQKAKIGRSINPSQLISMIINAGAKRVEVTLPEFTVLSATQIAKEETVNIIYGGLEAE